MTATELYNRETDVKSYEIPEKWKDSFNKFMFGSTMGADVDENGKVLNYVYYRIDFRYWYWENEDIIKRDEKIDTII